MSGLLVVQKSTRQTYLKFIKLAYKSLEELQQEIKTEFQTKDELEKYKGIIFAEHESQMKVDNYFWDSINLFIIGAFIALLPNILPTGDMHILQKILSMLMVIVVVQIFIWLPANFIKLFIHRKNSSKQKRDIAIRRALYFLEHYEIQ